MFSENKGEFTSDMFNSLLTRKEISHVFLSEISQIQSMIASEFSDIVTLKTIGKTWNDRPIQVLELDARSYMANKKVEVVQPLTKDGEAKKAAALIQTETDKVKNIDEMTSEMTDDEIVQQRVDEEKKLEFHQNFENLSEDDKLAGVLKNIGESNYL